MVADLNHLLGDYDISICSFGVYGTKYVRDGDPLPSSVKLTQGNRQVINVSHIYSAIEIGTILSIKLRQKETSLSFVTFKEKSSSVDVIIDSTGVAPGDYTLTLESFNKLSIAQSALKTDVIAIAISVQEIPTLPQFVDQPLSVKTLVVK